MQTETSSGSSDSRDSSDEALVTSARAGDEASVRVLADRWAPAAWRLAQVVGGPGSDADAAAIRALVAEVSIGRPTNGRAGERTTGPLILGRARSLALTGPIRPPDDADRYTTTLDEVVEAFAPLSERQRVSLWLTCVLGWPRGDMARVLDVSVTAADRLMSQAYAQFRHRYVAGRLQAPSLPRCLPALQALERFLGGTSTDEEAAAVEEHLTACRDCRDTVADLRRPGGILDRAVATAPEDLPDRAVQQWGQHRSGRATENDFGAPLPAVRRKRRHRPDRATRRHSFDDSVSGAAGRSSAHTDPPVAAAPAGSAAHLADSAPPVTPAVEPASNLTGPPLSAMPAGPAPAPIPTGPPVPATPGALETRRPPPGGRGTVDTPSDMGPSSDLDAPTSLEHPLFVDGAVTGAVQPAGQAAVGSDDGFNLAVRPLPEDEPFADGAPVWEVRSSNHLGSSTTSNTRELRAKRLTLAVRTSRVANPPGWLPDAESDPKGATHVLAVGVGFGESLHPDGARPAEDGAVVARDLRAGDPGPTPALVRPRHQPRRWGRSVRGHSQARRRLTVCAVLLLVTGLGGLGLMVSRSGDNPNTGLVASPGGPSETDAQSVGEPGAIETPVGVMPQGTALAEPPGAPTTDTSVVPLLSQPAPAAGGQGQNVTVSLPAVPTTPAQPPPASAPPASTPGNRPPPPPPPPPGGSTTTTVPPTTSTTALPPSTTVPGGEPGTGSAPIVVGGCDLLLEPVNIDCLP